MDIENKPVFKPYIKQQVENIDNNKNNYIEKPKNMEQMNSGTIDSKRINSIPLSQSNLFVSPDARKSIGEPLGLGYASNQYYKSTSKGVGKLVEM